MKAKSAPSSSAKIILILLLGAMLIATWGVGLNLGATDMPRLYLTLIMLSVAETLAVVHFVWLSGPMTKRKNMPLRMGGTAMLALYLLAVVVLTVMAYLEVPFPWLLTGHAICLLALITGWVLVSFAVRHAQKQDKRDRKRMASFADIRNRFGAFCYQLEQIAGVDQEVVRKALTIRDEVLRYARSDSTPGMGPADTDVAAKMTTLESALSFYQYRDVGWQWRRVG